MRYIIYGAGGIGSIMGGHLARTGHEVILIGRPGHVTIHPNTSRDDYHFDLSANIPLEMEGDKPGGYDIVFSPSRGGTQGFTLKG
jgi:ketopantoate reductase